MIKKGNNEIVALFKGDVEIEQLYGNYNLIYDADRIHAYVDSENNTLIIETDRHASFDDNDDSLALRSKAWGKASFENETPNRKVIKIEQYERQ